MTGTGQQPCLDLERETREGIELSVVSRRGDEQARDLTATADDGESGRDVRELFLELRAPLCRYLVALGLQKAEAEDVAQESFVRLCEQDSEWRPENVRAWMFRVAHNLAQDAHRRNSRRPVELLKFAEPAVGAVGSGFAEPSDERPSPEENLLERERDARLTSALGRLPRELRQCLHLRAEGLRYREIGEVMGVGTSTVAEWVHKGLKKLEQELA